MNIKEVSRNAVMEDFVVAHNMKISYMPFFRNLSAREYKVVVFDYSCREVVGRCPQHPEYMKRSDESDE
jgi:hypothetical protein